MKNYQAAADYISERIPQIPEIGLILGSGLGILADKIERPVILPFEEIPGFAVSTVSGHSGELVIGNLNGRYVAAMKGRVHAYEGYSQAQVTFPVRVMKLLGVQTMIITNACGALNPSFYPGALMLITDHINFTGTNPLIGPNEEEFGVRFPDMSQAYSQEMLEKAKRAAAKAGVEVVQGIYGGISGPAYFTQAELKMLRLLGADSIGMSTVPEVIVAAHAGLKVLGISCITDMAVPDETFVPLTHEQVLKVSLETRPKFIALIEQVLSEV